MQLRDVLIAIATLLASCESDCSNQQSRSCCKVCKNSKACGDTCIELKDTCHRAAGCACNE